MVCTILLNAGVTDYRTIGPDRCCRKSAREFLQKIRSRGKTGPTVGTRTQAPPYVLGAEPELFVPSRCRVRKRARVLFWSAALSSMHAERNQMPQLSRPVQDSIEFETCARANRHRRTPLRGAGFLSEARSSELPHVRQLGRLVPFARLRVQLAVRLRAATVMN